jgi:choline-glycine betaine transporter
VISAAARARTGIGVPRAPGRPRNRVRTRTMPRTRTATRVLAGGLETLQQAAIVAGAPFALVMIGLCFSFHKALRTEEIPGAEPRATVTIPEPAAAQLRPEVAGGS